MNIKLLSLLLSGFVLLNACTKSSSIDARKSGSAPPRSERISDAQLTDRDVFGDELTLDITEDDIQSAVEQAQGEFKIPLNASVILVQSGSRAPDAIMQKAMQKYYQVSTFSGIPAARKKQPAQPITAVKQTAVEVMDDLTESRSSVINANYMQALRYIAAKGRQKAVIVYWGELESGKYNTATKEMVWKKYSGGDLSGLSLRYLNRFALVDVASGEWATYSPVNIESEAATAEGINGSKAEITEQRIFELKQKSCQMMVEDLVNRYSKR